MDKIASIANTKNGISILDYGCGNMRLYNALLQLNFPFNYVGTDFKLSDSAAKIVQINDNCNFVPLSEITQIDRNSFDIICLSNVIHEISITAFAEVLLNIKLLLRQDGHFLLIDMSVLPKGELLGLPYFPNEIMGLFEPIDYIFETESGYPIIACEISPKKIMLPHIVIEKLHNLIIKKRDAFSFFSFELIDKCNMDIFNLKFKNINRRMKDEDLLGYTQYLSGLSNFRIIEFQQQYQPDNDNEFFVDLINLYITTFEQTNRQLSLLAMYYELYPKYSAVQIAYKLKEATFPHSLFGIDEDGELYATERLDYFLDNYTFDDLRKTGISVMSVKCEMD